MARTDGKQTGVDKQTTAVEKQPTAVEKLRALLAEPSKTIACPGVYDGFTARIALREGAQCLYMTGAGTSLSRLGLADLGIATLPDMLSNATLLSSISPTTPLIADADTGYGSPIMVARTVTSYIRAGVAGLHLEDQVVSKRCGHLEGKQVVNVDEWRARMRAAALARQRSGGDVVLIARTDALQGLGYEEAVKRLKVAVEEGADVAFLEGVTSAEEAKRFVADMAPTPCLFNHVFGGVSPELSTKEAEAIGYKVVIFPLMAIEVVYPAVRKAVREVLDKGRVESVEGGKRFSPRELFEVGALDELMEFDGVVGGSAYVGGA